MIKRIIKTDKAPAAVGPYSQAVKAGGFIFVSGQIPLNPSSGKLFKGNIARATELVLKNIQVILETAGASLRDVVKITLYLKNLEDFPQVNKVYAKFFPQNPPARTCVQVNKIPQEADLEIDAMAWIKD